MIPSEQSDSRTSSDSSDGVEQRSSAGLSLANDSSGGQSNASVPFSSLDPFGLTFHSSFLRGYVFCCGI